MNVNKFDHVFTRCHYKRTRSYTGKDTTEYSSLPPMQQSQRSQQSRGKSAPANKPNGLVIGPQQSDAEYKEHLIQLCMLMGATREELCPTQKPDTEPRQTKKETRGPGNGQPIQQQPTPQPRNVATAAKTAPRKAVAAVAKTAPPQAVAAAAKTAPPQAVAAAAKTAPRQAVAAAAKTAPRQAMRQQQSVAAVTLPQQVRGPTAYQQPPDSYPVSVAVAKTAQPAQARGQQRGQQTVANNWTVNMRPASENHVVRHPKAADNTETFRQLNSTCPAFKLIAIPPIANELSFPGVEKRIDMKTVNEGKDPTEILWLMGDEAKETFGTTDTQTSRIGKQIPIDQLPGGLGVLSVDKREMNEEQINELHRMEDRAAFALQELFTQEDQNPSTGLTFMPMKKRGKNILGFNKSKGPAGYKGSVTFGRNYSPTIADVFSYLPPDLAEYLMSYLKGIAEYIGCPYDCIPEWVLILLQYIRGGFPFHVDGVADFNNHAGIIANIAMGSYGERRLSNPKYFDLVKLLPDTEGPQAFRMTHDQFDCTYMSGESRVLWGHGIPIVPRIQQTAGIKMGENTLMWRHKWMKEILFEFPKFPKPVSYIDTIVAVEEGRKRLV